MCREGAISALRGTASLASASLLALWPRSPESSLGLGGTRVGLGAPGPVSEPHATSQEEQSPWAAGWTCPRPRTCPMQHVCTHTHTHTHTRIYRVTLTFFHCTCFTALTSVKGHLVRVFTRFFSAPSSSTLYTGRA